MHGIASPKSGTSATYLSGSSNPASSPGPGKPCPERLLEHLDPMLRGLSARLAGADLSLREDFFQEGAVAVLTALARCDEAKGLVEHFAARSARGRLLNYQRELRHRQREISVGTFAEPGADGAENSLALALQLGATEVAVSAPAFDAMDCNLIRETAATVLTRNELRAIELVHFEGWQANEAAVEIGVSPPRITQLISSALRKLREHLVSH